MVLRYASKAVNGRFLSRKGWASHGEDPLQFLEGKELKVMHGAQGAREAAGHMTLLNVIYTYIGIGI
eukprot:1144253-Pelagomonas_calceolata.AAC.2